MDDPSPSVQTTIVVCQHDSASRELLAEHLACDGYSVLPAPSAADALDLLRSKPVDLLVLDLGLSDGSGLDVLGETREDDSGVFDSSLPVIVLSSYGDADARVRALESGADDYLVKPFHYPELRARIGAVIRRSAGRREGPQRVGDLVIDPARRRVWIDGRDVALSNKEYSLLRVLISDPIRVFSKQELLEEVGGFRSASRTRTLDSHASRLRRKLDPEHSRYVINCWGVGYRLVDSIPETRAVA